jgi:multidrug efflux pump subunit AcrB
MLSGGAALTLLADLSGWMLAGPSRMLHALEMMDRRQVRLQTRMEKSPSRMGGLRVRSLFAAAVWLALAIFSLATYQNIFTKTSFSGYLVITFWGVWTVWLVDLLRRVARQ